MKFDTLDDLEVKGKRVLVRADLNVPLKDGKVADETRIARHIPTLRELAEKGAKVIILSHFGRPKGRFQPSMSLKPVVTPLARQVGRPVFFVGDCVGPKAESAVKNLKNGELLLLENTRFHSGEEKNDRDFASRVARLGDVFVNDAFSATHRAHATTTALAYLMPAAAGRAMELELSHLKAALAKPVRPLMAVVGGAKVSTKIELLTNLVTRVEVLAIGGAMANTFLAAEGAQVGKSLYEPHHLPTARRVLHIATESGTAILLPKDVVVAREMRENAPHRTVAATAIGPDDMALDLGAESIQAFKKRLVTIKTLVWNGPLGTFERPPFDKGTVEAARAVAEATRRGDLLSVAGGGDTIAALAHAGVEKDFSYISTAGGAFLEWLEGRELPGVEALKAAHKKQAARR
ncbi:MAG: phosphoglycerate kinase [Rhizomicrobium sp.]